MGDLHGIVNWVGGLGGSAVMALVLVALYRRWYVHHAELDRVVEDCSREREARQRAEQKLIDTIPDLIRVTDQMSRVPHVAEKAATVAEQAVTVVAETVKKDRKP